MVSRRSVLYGLGTTAIGYASYVGLQDSHPSNDRVSNPDAETESDPTPEPEPEIDLSRTGELLIRRVNDMRTGQRGLAALEESDCIKAKSQAHADNMAEKAYFSHTAPDGTTQRERYASCGNGGGENIAKTFVNSRVEMPDETIIIETTEELTEALMTQWVNSRPHRERGIYGEWRATNVGLARSGSDVYAVMGFSR
jgi:uncharacterized protein YkwD